MKIKVVVHKAEEGGFWAEVYKKGVNYASLFMGIEGICRDIISKYL